MLKAVAGVFAAVLLSAAVQAETSHRVTASAGSLGYGLALDRALNQSLSARLQLQGYRRSFDGSRSSIDYQMQLGLRALGLLLDWRPFQRGFRISGGVFYNDSSLDGDAVPSRGSYSIGGTRYDAAEVGALSGELRFKRYVPYVGVGWERPGGHRLGWNFDLGVAFQGLAEVDLEADGPVADDPGFSADLAREEEQLEQSLRSFQFYPVFSLGMYYRF